ncbi:MAG: hypothetical protein WBQ23_11595 [Bacteroidota bacterium]
MMKQLLLLTILGVVTITATFILLINTSGAQAQQVSKDAVTEDCLNLAAAAVGYYLKPALLQGGNQSFNNIDIADCGMTEAGSKLTGCNLNGVYTIEATGAKLTITGISAGRRKNAVVLICDMEQSRENRVTITRVAM